MQNSIQHFVTHPYFQHTVSTIIILNALLYDMETFKIFAPYTALLDALNSFFLLCYVIEIGLKLIAYK